MSGFEQGLIVLWSLFAMFMIFMLVGVKANKDKGGGTGG